MDVLHDLCPINKSVCLLKVPLNFPSCDPISETKTKQYRKEPCLGIQLAKQLPVPKHSALPGQMGTEGIALQGLITCTKATVPGASYTQSLFKW